MATYCVITTDRDDWGEPENRFKNRAPAEQRMQELVTAGHRPVRLMKWGGRIPKEVARIPAESEATPPATAAAS